MIVINGIFICSRLSHLWIGESRYLMTRLLLKEFTVVQLRSERNTKTLTKLTFSFVFFCYIWNENCKKYWRVLKTQIIPVNLSKKSIYIRTQHIFVLTLIEFYLTAYANVNLIYVTILWQRRFSFVSVFNTTVWWNAFGLNFISVIY